MLKQQQILKREQIRSELEHILEYPLTVAVAAMGYGKTTAAKEFLTYSNIKHIWVSVERDESSPQYIWSSLTSQLSRTYPELGKRLHALGFPSDPPQRDKVLRILEDLTYRTNTVLVIDDYHCVHSPEFDSLIERIIRSNIDGFHILILSRTMPEINIEELRLKGYCYLIKSQVFEVSMKEIKDFFMLYGYHITEDIIRQIDEISEGWISAVYLIMQRYAEIGRVERVRSMEKLIETAVMSRYTSEEIKVLKALCALDSFTPQQAVYVTDDRNTAGVIRNLSYGNSFIRYDVEGDTYRIHNILSNYLNNLLQEQPVDIEPSEIYKRSGEWCIQNGDTVTGLRYLLKAKEYDLILSQFEDSSINSVIDNNSSYILELFKSIPEDAKYRHPIGYLAYIGFYVTNVDPASGARLLEQAEQYYQNDISIPPELKKHINGEIELIKAYIGFNDAALMRERLAKAHEILKGHSLIANKDKIITFGSPHSLYLYYREKGKLLWTMNCVKEMFHDYTAMAGDCGKGFDSILKAEYLLETGEVEEAELNAYKAIYKARTMGQVSVIICAQLTIARICAVNGKFSEALDIMGDLSGEVGDSNSPILSSAYDLCAGYIGGIAGKESSFAKWLRLGDIEQSEVLYQGMGFNYIVYGKYLLLKKEYLKLEVLCEDMHKAFSLFNNMLGYLHSFILEAIAKYNLYGAEKAEAAMTAALDIGRSDGIVLPFAEYGVHIMELLKYIQKFAGDDEYLDNVLVYNISYSDNAKNADAVRGMLPELTNREKDILEFVVEGKTNREIASALYIAEVTVRKNITAIYRKLDVTGRASAVKKCIELKII